MKRIVGAVAAACLAGALLTGCGGSSDNSGSPNDSTDTSTSTGGDTTTPPTSSSTTTDSGDDNGASGDYCDDLKSAKVTVEALGASQMTQASFDKMSGVLQIIASEAPDSVSDDWTTLSHTIDSISQALQSAGISIDDLAKVGQPGGPTIGPAQLQALSAALKGLDESSITQATTAINAEVLKDCGLKLGMGS